MGTLCKIVKTAVFTLILIILFHVFTNILINKGTFDKGNQYQLRMKEFYDEVPGTLDAVYIGASHVYTYWQAPIAWNKDGIAVFPFSSGSQPVTAIPFLIEEVKKIKEYQEAVYMRVDAVKVGDSYHVMEIELLEPQLFFEWIIDLDEREKAYKKFVQSIKEKLN